MAAALLIQGCGSDSGTTASNTNGSTTNGSSSGGGAAVGGGSASGGGGTGGGGGQTDCVDGATFGAEVVCTADNSQCSYVVRVMHYNVHALPETLSGENPNERLKRIGDILSDRRDAGTQPHFVLLQEAFDKVDRIVDRAGYAYFVEGPTQSFGLDSGVFILSDHPVLSEDRQSFEACAGFDCGAEKGVLAIRTQIAVMPSPLIVITTHLQAQSEHDDVRIEQIDELLPYLAAQNIETNASVFAGDFNFKAKRDHDAHPSYLHFKTNTPYIPSGKACLDNALNCTVVHEDPNKSDENDVWLSTNDHQFYYASASAPYRMTVQQYQVTFTEDFQGEPLSDHWAREADYCFTWSP